MTWQGRELREAVGLAEAHEVRLFDLFVEQEGQFGIQVGVHPPFGALGIDQNRVRRHAKVRGVLQLQRLQNRGRDVGTTADGFREDDLRRAVETQLAAIPGAVRIRSLQCFSPSPPKPEKRLGYVVTDSD